MSLSSNVSSDHDNTFSISEEEEKSELFTKGEVNDLVRDLGVSKELVHILGSCLKEKGFVILIIRL